ncbi:MAG: phage holin family protein [Polyangia bacterium]|jgi:hypothetical protein
MKNGERDKHDGVLGVARDTADALAKLTLQHLRLARLEIRADLRAMGTKASLIAGLAALAIVGYGLAMAGLACVMGGSSPAGVPLLLIGTAHVLVAGAGMIIALARLRRWRPMNLTADEVSRTLIPLGIGSTAPGVPHSDIEQAAARGRTAREDNNGSR